VYAYYGQGRKRFSQTLAKNAIVVTTYGTLSSDAVYWKKKDGNADSYCSPCEQIYWWRIICDESHILRGSSTTTDSVMRIAAENKWCVTGTPINTAITDLKNQLKFIGVDHVDHYFRKCDALWLNHSLNAPRKLGRSHDFFSSLKEAPIGNFLFLFRAILMRHTMKMTSRGTNTDLMSLPPKSERTVYVDFSESERTEYRRLEGEALSRYISLRRSYEFRRHHLKVLQLLMPLRLSCAGKCSTCSLAVLHKLFPMVLNLKHKQPCSCSRSLSTLLLLEFHQVVQ